MVAMLTWRILTSPIETVRRCHGVSIPPGGLCQMVVVIGSTSRKSPIVIKMTAKMGWPIIRRSTTDWNAAPIPAQQAMANRAAIQKSQPHVCSAW